MPIQDTKRVMPAEDCGAVDVYVDSGIVVLRQDDDRVFLTANQVAELLAVLPAAAEGVQG